MGQENRSSDNQPRRSSQIGVGIAFGFLFGMMLGNIAMGLMLGVVGAAISDEVQARKDKAEKD